MVCVCVWGGGRLGSELGVGLTWQVGVESQRAILTISMLSYRQVLSYGPLNGVGQGNDMVKFVF